MHNTSRKFAAVVLAISATIVGCGSDSSAPSTQPAAPSQVAPTDATTPQLQPTPSVEALSGLGQWCAALEPSQEQIRGIVVDEPGEWGIRPSTVTPAADISDGAEEALTCGIRFGPDFESNSVTMREARFVDEQAASLDPWREPDPGAITIEDIDLGDEAVFVIYVAPYAVPAFISYSIVTREGDRTTRITLRDHSEDLSTFQADSRPANEAMRRDQLMRITELLAS